MRIPLSFEYIIPDNTFSDPDGDPLVLSCKVNHLGSDGSTPLSTTLGPTGSFWLKFDKDAKKIFGTPALTDV
jgi:hypothetical protein